jgi:ketosteroid isomerase-like protein
VEWTEPEGGVYPGTFRGPDAVLQNLFMRLGPDWDDFTVTPHQFVGSEDTVVALGEYGGTHKLTGKSVQGIPFAHAVKLRDGKIIRFMGYYDTVLFQRAIQP